MKPLHKILLVGYYGFDNVGDELLLLKSLKIIQDTYSSSQIAILYKSRSVKKSIIHKDLKNYCLYNRVSIFQILKQLIKADTVVLGGGGLLQDNTSRRSLYYYLSIILVAQIFKKHIFLLGQGLEPLKHTFSKWLVSKLNVTGISVRDEQSLELIKSYNLKSKNIILASDLAYYKASFTITEKLEKNKMIGLSLRPLKLNPQVKIDLIKFFNSHLDVPINFLDFQQGHDSKALEYFEINNNNIRNIFIMNEVFINNKLTNNSPFIVISMRYHACVWASLFGIPFIGLANDTKIIELARQLKQEFICLKLKRFKLGELVKKYNIVKRNHQKYRDSLIQVVPNLIEKAKLNKILTY